MKYAYSAVTEEGTEKNTVTHCSLACVWGRKQWCMDRHYFSVPYPIGPVHNSFARKMPVWQAMNGVSI